MDIQPVCQIILLGAVLHYWWGESVPVKSRPVRGRKFFTLWWASLTMTRRIKAQLRTTQNDVQRVEFLTQTFQIRWQEKQQRGSPTCRSWGQSAPSSVCQTGRRLHHPHRPLRRFRLNRTERCCLTGAGRAETENIMKANENSRLETDYESLVSSVSFQHLTLATK